MKLLQYLPVPYNSPDNHRGGLHQEHYYSPFVDTAGLQQNNIFTITTSTTEQSIKGRETSSVNMDLLGAFGNYMNPFACTISVFESRVLGEFLLSAKVPSY